MASSWAWVAAPSSAPSRRAGLLYIDGESFSVEVIESRPEAR
jgi:hypothetical protein